MNSAVASTRTTCPYCGVGCGVRAEHAGARLLAVGGDAAHPANAGRLCVKGSTLPETQAVTGRLLRPRIDGREVAWSAALDQVAAGFAQVLREHGPQAVAFYLSGQLLTEDYYVANKLMKGFLGSANVDTNSRLCMASAVAAHQRAFGEDVVPCHYSDIDHCELLVLVGSNAAWAHPVLYQRIAARRASGALKLVVIDPRRTATCDAADLHLALRPGSDTVLFNALLAHLEAAGATRPEWVAAHSRGFADALAAAQADAHDVAARTGLAAADIARFFAWFTAHERTLTLFSQGVNQAVNGTDKANAIINCHLATARIGAAGMGPFSITGQPNAMGGREVGGMANHLAAHRDFAPENVAAVAQFWDAPRMARAPGLKAVEMFDAVARGEIRALWIMGTNPAVSLPQSARVRAALAACPFLVVSDCVAHTDTTAFAKVLLPAAGWGEKNGTVTNSERCISRQRGFLAAPGEARPDWWMLSEVARRLGFGAAFAYRSAHEVFVEHAALSALPAPTPRLFNLGELATLDAAAFDAFEPRQWPLDGARPFADGRFSTADGRARFIAITSVRPGQQPDASYPFVLNTGRLRDQWHTMTRTGVAPRLFGHVDTPTLQIHGADAARLGVQAGDLVEVCNDGGRLRAIAQPDEGQRPGELFFPMHWNDGFAWPARVGALVAPVTDPVSGQPESKHAAVRVERLAVDAWVRFAARAVPDWGGMESTVACAGGVLFRTCLPLAGGWRGDLALAGDAEALVRQWIGPQGAGSCSRSGPDGGVGPGVGDGAGVEVIAYDDAAHGTQRRLLVWNGEVVLALFVARQRADLPAVATLERLFAQPADAMRWRLLTGFGDGDAATAGPRVCTCFEVTRGAITAAIGAGADSIEALGARLRCGTNCGSCIPELRQLLTASTTPS